MAATGDDVFIDDSINLDNIAIFNIHSVDFIVVI